LAFLTSVSGGLHDASPQLEEEAPVSVTTNAATVPSGLPRRTRKPQQEPLSLRLLEIAGVAPVLAILGLQVVLNSDEFADSLPAILPWLLVVAVADLMPIPIWGTVELMMSFPVLLASAFVFPPYVAGLLSLVGTVDRRELRREISAGRGLFNRSNVALSVMSASWVFQQTSGMDWIWPGVLASALAALVVDLAINSCLLIMGTRLLTGLPTTRLVKNVYGGSQPLTFVVSYAFFGLLAVVLATVYRSAGAWGLAAFAIPLLLAREMFVQWKSLADAQTRIQQKQSMLTRVSSRMADERRDERLAVAAGIHDELLPPLYKVHLMGQVLRQDLATGRLLDLETDLPDLLQATEAASRALRDLIRDLRNSTVGAGGLGSTLELLGRSLMEEAKIHIEVRTQEVGGTPLTHLLLYQVAREALTNAVRHSGADTARVLLEDAGDGIRLIIEDNGRGFDPELVDQDSHFGLQLMRERVELAGGNLYIQTDGEEGTRLIVKVPTDR
jgi:signal transduction histidine kinase